MKVEHQAARQIAKGRVPPRLRIRGSGLTGFGYQSVEILMGFAEHLSEPHHHLQLFHDEVFWERSRFCLTQCGQTKSGLSACLGVHEACWEDPAQTPRVQGARLHDAQKITPSWPGETRGRESRYRAEARMAEIPPAEIGLIFGWLSQHN